MTGTIVRRATSCVIIVFKTQLLSVMLSVLNNYEETNLPSFFLIHSAHSVINILISQFFVTELLVLFHYSKLLCFPTRSLCNYSTTVVMAVMHCVTCKSQIALLSIPKSFHVSHLKRKCGVSFL